LYPSLDDIAYHYDNIIPVTDEFVNIFFPEILTVTSFFAILFLTGDDNMKRFREVRQALGMTQQKFADGLRISSGALSKIEIEDRTPSDQLIHSLCVTYNVNEDWMRTGEGEMFNSTSDSALDKLCDEYGLGPAHRALVAAYLELPARARDLMCEYVKAAAAKIVREESDAQLASARAAFDVSARHADGNAAEQ
jgi:transcriptional regulator with XRE-family HTH domain